MDHEISEQSKAQPAISVEHISKNFGSYCAVNDASFVVPKNSIIGLVGGNGAGKTTTLAMIMGLTIPTKGRALVLGHNMASARHRVLHRMNFQSPYVAMPGKLTVRENLNVFGRLYNVPHLKERIADLAYDLGVGELLDCETGALSAGQKTRASIAKALLNQPEILLLDEPTASLDPGRAVWVRELLKNYQKDRQASILMSSHNMIEIETLCDYVVVMDLGKVLSISTPSQLMAQYNCRDLEKIITTIVAQRSDYSSR